MAVGAHGSLNSVEQTAVHADPRAARQTLGTLQRWMSSSPVVAATPQPRAGLLLLPRLPEDRCCAYTRTRCDGGIRPVSAPEAERGVWAGRGRWITGEQVEGGRPVGRNSGDRRRGAPGLLLCPGLPPAGPRQPPQAAHLQDWLWRWQGVMLSHRFTWVGGPGPVGSAACLHKECGNSLLPAPLAAFHWYGELGPWSSAHPPVHCSPSRGPPDDPSHLSPWGPRCSLPTWSWREHDGRPVPWLVTFSQTPTLQCAGNSSYFQLSVNKTRYK